MKAFPLKTSLLIMGMSGIAAQIILLRELLISFLGNELTLGIRETEAPAGKDLRLRVFFKA